MICSFYLCILLIDSLVCFFIYVFFSFDPSTSQAACIGWDVLKQIPKQIPNRKSIGIPKWIQI